MNHNSQDKQKLLKLLLQKKGIGVKTNTIPPRNPSQLVPLSFSQERLWFLYQLEANGYTYNMPFRFQIDGNLDVNIFRKALETIMQRHELLRTCFQEVDKTPRQIIKLKIQLNLPLLDLLQELSHLYEAFDKNNLILDQISLFNTVIFPFGKDNSYFAYFTKSGFLTQ